MKHWKKVSLTAAGLVALAVAAFAQDPTQTQAVRLSFVTGQVRITDGSNQVITEQAVANTPLFAGYVLQTGDDGQAEVQFDDGTVGRIPPDSALTLSSLGAGQDQLTLSNGMAYFTLRGAERILAGGFSITSRGPASIRIKLDEAPGELAVFSGTAHLEGNGATDVSGGQSFKFGGGGVAQSIEPDSWDQWNTDRDQALTQAFAAATPATQSLPDNANPAWGDLNQSGNWYNVPDQGYVWSPYDASDPSWDPYGNGYWMDTPSYGYTWVSGYSWGYLPYQCGLWNWYSGFGWGWAPGGCNPWWRGGSGWAINIGGHRPGGWRPPSRPNRPRWGGRGNGDGRAFRPSPIVSVRREGPRGDSPLPLRDRRSPVTIGNATVTPLRPVNRPNRPIYNNRLGQQSPRSSQGFGGNSGSQFNGGGRQPGNYNPGGGNNNRPSQNYRQQPNQPSQQQRPTPGTTFNPGSNARPSGSGMQQARPSAPQSRPAPAPRPSAPHHN